LRDLTRHRADFIRARATLCNRVQKVLEGANIKFAAGDGVSYAPQSGTLPRVGADHWDRCHPEATIKRLTGRL
jgi:hypothetical protein